MRQSQWEAAIAGKREAIERAIGMPLGKILGCGHWGCVFDSTPPWVVKLSIDPTEGPIWSKIGGLVREEVWGTEGFVELKSLHRLTPDLQVGKKKHTVWAIVREAIEPVYREWSPKELGLRGRGKLLRTSKFTNQHLGFPAPLITPVANTPDQEDFLNAVIGLQKYRELATLWHLYMSRRFNRSTMEQISRLEEYTNINWTVLERGIPTKEKAERVKERMEKTLNVRFFSGGVAGALGESLHMLFTHELYLRDVHLMNIGWHVGKSDEDYTRLVIFDPGHTPTEADDIESVLIENPREAL